MSQSQRIAAVPQTLSGALEEGEDLIWYGRPRPGLVLGKRDLLLIPFSALWAGFAFFWEGSVFTSNAPVFFRLWGIPFVLVGCYLLFGRFFHDAWRRSRVLYALTSQRVLILAPGSQISLELTALNEIRTDLGRDGRGSIAFGPETSPFMRRDFGIWSGKPAVPTFEMIENVQTVFTEIRRAQKQVKYGGI